MITLLKTKFWFITVERKKRLSIFWLNCGIKVMWFDENCQMTLEFKLVLRVVRVTKVVRVARLTRVVRVTRAARVVSGKVDKGGDGGKGSEGVEG